MKYNVKQAVSGIQGEMDKASSNQMLSRALGGLAGGIEGVATRKYNQDRYSDLMGPQGPLAQQKSLFEDMAKSDDKFERLLGKENLAKLSVFQAGLSPSNMDTFGKDYADQMGSKSMFSPLIELKKSQMMADSYGAKNAEARRQNDLLEQMLGGGSTQTNGGNPFSGLGSLFSGFGAGAQPDLPDLGF